MAIKYQIAKHAWAFPSKCLATSGGKHIYNVKLTSDAIDNGNFVGKGAWLSLDLYAEAAPTTFAGVVREKAANGNYYVEVTAEPVNAYFVYQVPMIEEEFTREFQKEENFFNEKGDIVRVYELAVGDIVEISDAGFTSTPSVGAIVALSGNKLA